MIPPIAIQAAAARPGQDSPALEGGPSGERRPGVAEPEASPLDGAPAEPGRTSGMVLESLAVQLDAGHGSFGALEQDLRRLMREAGEASFAVSQSKREHREHTRGLLLGVLDVVDALDRVFESAATKSADVTTQMKIWLSGFKTARLLLGRTLEDQGLTRVVPALGDSFDPHCHRVSETVAQSGQPDGSIAAVALPGWLWEGALLRKPAVAVVRNDGAPDEITLEEVVPGETAPD